MNAKIAKKNIRNAVSLIPVSAMRVVTASLRTAALVSSTHRLPYDTDSSQKLMITPFIDRGAWLYANSRPVADTSTSPIVSSAYGSTCQVIDTASPPSIPSCSLPAAIQARPENAMPDPTERTSVGPGRGVYGRGNTSGTGEHK